MNDSQNDCIAIDRDCELASLRVLSDRFPNIDAATAEIARLSAVQTLPKGSIHVISDIFRRRDASGGKKALWLIFVFCAPFLGMLVYMIANSGNAQLFMLEDKPGDRALLDALRTIPRAKPKTSAAPRRRP